MATDKTYNSTPVESVGSAEDVLNVTAVEEATADAQSAPQTDLDAAAEAVAADFAEEDAALAAEQAGLAIEGETAEESARRELLEETGYGGGRWEQFMVTSANPSNHNNRVYTFLAVGVEKQDEQHTEAGEDIDVHLFTREEVEALLADDEIMQCLHAAPLWKYMLRNPF